jgi:hypothetical protein
MYAAVKMLLSLFCVSADTVDTITVVTQPRFVSFDLVALFCSDLIWIWGVQDLPVVFVLIRVVEHVFEDVS